MEKQDFIEFLNSESEHFDMTEAPLEGKNGLYVNNKVFETQTHFTDEIISQMELKELVVATHHGKNIEQMTRVTGYFSKIGGWNKGKIGELNERKRVGDV